MSFVDNPVINSPFDEPGQQFQLNDDGQPTGLLLSGRRPSIQVVPVPAAKRKVKQGELELGDAEQTIKQNQLVNEIRERVAVWRSAGRPKTTPETKRLLDHWSREDRARRLFFCQVEALE